MKPVPAVPDRILFELISTIAAIADGIPSEAFPAVIGESFRTVLFNDFGQNIRDILFVIVVVDMKIPVL